jgi:fumarate reductase subunit D
LGLLPPIGEDEERITVYEMKSTCFSTITKILILFLVMLPLKHSFQSYESRFMKAVILFFGIEAAVTGTMVILTPF